MLGQKYSPWKESLLQMTLLHGFHVVVVIVILWSKLLLSSLTFTHSKALDYKSQAVRVSARGRFGMIASKRTKLRRYYATDVICAGCSTVSCPILVFHIKFTSSCGELLKYSLEVSGVCICFGYIYGLS